MFQVSIMQIASEKKVFIFDLIKLHREVPERLDSCLTRILLSPGILKLGMKILNSLVSWIYQKNTFGEQFINLTFEGWLYLPE